MRVLVRFLARITRKKRLPFKQSHRSLYFERLEDRQFLDAAGANLPTDGPLLKKPLGTDYPAAEYAFDAAFDRESMALAVDYLLQDHHGGTIHDAEKSPDFTDDAMCWASAASNVLA